MGERILVSGAEKEEHAAPAPAEKVLTREPVGEVGPEPTKSLLFTRSSRLSPRNDGEQIALF